MFALHAFPGVAGPQYDAAADNETVVFVQIESKSGLESVEKIAAVPGLDGVLIGESISGRTLYQYTQLMRCRTFRSRQENRCPAEWTRARSCYSADPESSQVCWQEGGYFLYVSPSSSFSDELWQWRCSNIQQVPMVQTRRTVFNRASIWFRLSRTLVS